MNTLSVSALRHMKNVEPRELVNAWQCLQDPHNPGSEPGCLAAIDYRDSAVGRWRSLPTSKTEISRGVHRRSRCDVTPMPLLT